MSIDQVHIDINNRLDEQAKAIALANVQAQEDKINMERELERAKKQQEAIAKFKADQLEKAKKDASLRMKLEQERKKAEDIAQAKELLKHKL